MSSLLRGDLAPEMKCEPPGPKSRQFARRLARTEAPVVNTIVGGQAAIVWQEALGSSVLDVDGNRYIDLTAGFGAAAVGHRRPEVVEAVRNQADQLLHGLADVYAHPTRVRLSERLSELAPMAETQVYFAVSGADAIEIALKTAVLYTGRGAALAFDPAYHGLTLGALNVTSRPEFREPFATALRSDVFRLPFGCPLSDLGDFLDRHPDIGAVIFEPLVGREGVLLPPPNWLSGLERTCRKRDILLVADEIFTGFGRTGALFLSSAEGMTVDLLCCGKALGGGLPIAAVLGRRSVLEAWDRQGEALHTSTFLANPLSCAAALAVLDILERDDLSRRAAAFAPTIENRLRRWRSFDGVVDTRGRGLIWAVELDSRQKAATIAGEALRRGLILLASGAGGNVLEICPPLTISEDQLMTSLAILEDVLEKGLGSRRRGDDR